MKITHTQTKTEVIEVAAHGMTVGEHINILIAEAMERDITIRDIAIKVTKKDRRALLAMRSPMQTDAQSRRAK